jgi:hypothetical protein
MDVGIHNNYFFPTSFEQCNGILDVFCIEYGHARPMVVVSHDFLAAFGGGSL